MRAEGRSDHEEGSVSIGAGEHGRRQLLTMLGATGAAIVAAQAVRPDPAGAGHDGTNTMHLGQSNTSPGGASTALAADVGSSALVVTNNGDGGGVEGAGELGPGVFGRNSNTLPEENSELTSGVLGTADLGAGITGTSVQGPGVQAFSQGSVGLLAFGGAAGPGVRGLGFHDHGVLGQTAHPDMAGVVGEAHSCLERGSEDPEDPCNQPSTGTGVLGRGQAGVGVRGESNSGAGVEAFSNGGLALRVLGPAAFTTAGAAVVPEGQSSVFVADNAVTAASHVQVTLASDPGPRNLSWVERAPGSGFTVHLAEANRRNRRETALTYLLVEPA